MHQENDPAHVPENAVGVPLQRAPEGMRKDMNDDYQSRQNRERHEGFPVGRYINPPPMLFTSDNHPLWMADMYRGRSAFLICNGPSFANNEAYPKDLLRQPGILTLGLNNGPKVFRPNLWVSVDDPENWIRSIWHDPLIQKFVPICHANKTIFNSDTWQETNIRTRDCPNVIYYKRNEHFKPEQFLWEDTFNWGNHKDTGGKRSVMLVATRLLFYLGVRRIYLLGVDFNMVQGSQNYCFAQDRHPSSVHGNNQTYEALKERYTSLLPYFKEVGLEIYNCNPDSALKVFPYRSYKEAINDVMAEFGNIDLANERTEGLYDRKYNEKKAKEEHKKKNIVMHVPPPKNVTEHERKEVKKRLDKARSILDEIKKLKESSLAQLKHPGATEDYLTQVRASIESLENREQRARIMFRTIEDEKRIKHGEEPRWMLWSFGTQCVQPEMPR